jgi:hypothetical protein
MSDWCRSGCRSTRGRRHCAGPDSSNLTAGALGGVWHEMGQVTGAEDQPQAMAGFQRGEHRSELDVVPSDQVRGDRLPQCLGEGKVGKDGPRTSG